MLRERRVRAIAVGLLLAFLAAPVSALALGLHLAHESHDEPALLASLGMIATHGHDHRAATAEHEHSTVRSVGPQAPAPAVAGAPAVSPEPARCVAAPGFVGAPAPTGSPPLFRQHCALLL